MPVSRVTFWKQFKVKSCSAGLKSGTKEEVLREIVGNLVASGVLDEGLVDDAVKTLLEREELASTGVGQNVAIPHVNVDGLEEAVASLSVHSEGVEWAAVDGDPVKVLFTVLRPEHAGESHDPDRHLEMMRWIASLSRNGDFRRFAIQARTRTELVDLLKEMS